METILLTITAIVITLDVFTNAFLILYAPKWSRVKRDEIAALREHASELKKQNHELIVYIQHLEEG